MILFDTSKKTYIKITPKPEIRMYVCGVTPYASAHLGHILTFMTYDLLQRRLEDIGSTVMIVRNITDVDEPIYVKAAELNMDYRDLAQDEIHSFQEVMEALNFRAPTAEPKASEFIDEMAVAVKVLLDKGIGYYVGQDIYYDTSKNAEYGTLCGYPRDLMHKLLFDRGGDPDRSGKRDPLDFLLWRAISDSNDPAQWQTVLGSGRPGWHIECTVMSLSILGPTFDIHGGGADLIFPHHESEIAQSHGLGTPNPACIWAHVSPLLYAGEKMSKSLGNLVFAKDLLLHHSSDVIRLSLMHYHHRYGGEWQNELLAATTELLDNFHAAARSATSDQAEVFLGDIRDALDDDLNTPEVIGAFCRFIKQAKKTDTSSKNAPPAINKALDLLGLSPITE